MNRIKLAVIADDFTGGADAASFLKRKHANVVLLTGIPLMLPDCDCVVFALKIRSVPVSDAIKKVHDVLLFLEQYQVEHFFLNIALLLILPQKEILGLLWISFSTTMI